MFHVSKYIVRSHKWFHISNIRLNKRYLANSLNHHDKPSHDNHQDDHNHDDHNHGDHGNNHSGHETGPYDLPHQRYDDDNAYFPGMSPNYKYEGWEAPAFITVFVSALMLWFGSDLVDDESFRDWAKREALAREKAKAEGIEIEFGKWYSDVKLDHYPREKGDDDDDDDDDDDENKCLSRLVH